VPEAKQAVMPSLEGVVTLLRRIMPFIASGKLAASQEKAQV
jgi:hypothetical protein